MFRFKTALELAETGWREDEPGYYDHPSYDINIVPEMLDLALELTQDQIEDVFADGVVDLLGYAWIPQMFVEISEAETETDRVGALCNCRWNRHPLYCSCPK